MLHSTATVAEAERQEAEGEKLGQQLEQVQAEMQAAADLQQAAQTALNKCKAQLHQSTRWCTLSCPWAALQSQARTLVTFERSMNTAFGQLCVYAFLLLGLLASTASMQMHAGAAVCHIGCKTLPSALCLLLYQATEVQQTCNCAIQQNPLLCLLCINNAASPDG